MRNGTFWPTGSRPPGCRGGDARGREQVRLGRLPQRLDQDAVLVLLRQPDRQAGRDGAARRQPQQSEDLLERQPAVGEGGGGEAGLGRRVAEAELHAELLGDVAGDLRDRRLNQHLRPALVELRHQRARSSWTSARARITTALMSAAGWMVISSAASEATGAGPKLSWVRRPRRRVRRAEAVRDVGLRPQGGAERIDDRALQAPGAAPITPRNTSTSVVASAKCSW